VWAWTYAEELVRRGASVVGFDQSPQMIELCRDRVPSGEFRVHDLADPLDWIDDASFDLVLLALAIEYVDDRVSALLELRRVITPQGALVISRQHPTADWLANGGNYFDTRIIEETWSRGWHLRYWLAPLEQTCEEIAQSGFLIGRLLERDQRLKLRRLIPRIRTPPTRAWLRDFSTCVEMRVPLTKVRNFMRAHPQSLLHNSDRQGLLR